MPHSTHKYVLHFKEGPAEGGGRGCQLFMVSLDSGEKILDLTMVSGGDDPIKLEELVEFRKSELIEFRLEDYTNAK